MSQSAPHTVHVHDQSPVELLVGVVSRPGPATDMATMATPVEPVTEVHA